MMRSVRWRAPSAFYSRLSSAIISRRAVCDASGDVAPSLRRLSRAVKTRIVLTSPAVGSLPFGRPPEIVALRRRQLRPPGHAEIGPITPERIQDATQSPGQRDDGNPSAPPGGERVRPRRAARRRRHSCRARSTQLACTSSARSSRGPVLVIAPLCWRSAELSSDGTNPRNALARAASWPKRSGVSSTA